MSVRWTPAACQALLWLKDSSEQTESGPVLLELASGPNSEQVRLRECTCEGNSGGPRRRGHVVVQAEGRGLGQGDSKRQTPYLRSGWSPVAGTLRVPAQGVAAEAWLQDAGWT